MRLSTESDGRDASNALATIRAALEEGAVVLDTARAYGLDDGDAGHNERLVGEASVGSSTLVVTKCGMRRPDGAWVPDGRASTILEDAQRSRAALGRPIDLLLLHAPDPRTAFATSVRALARAVEDRHTRAIGLCNVSVAQLEEATSITQISAVQVALGAYDDAAARSGLVRRVGELGIPLLAHSPLGGPARAARLHRDSVVSGLSRELGISPARLFLAYLLAVHPAILPLVGARRPETARDAMAASTLVLDDATLLALDARFPGLGRLRVPPRVPIESSREVVLLMGVPGAGKSNLAAEWVARGYERLNRDTVGGTLRGITRMLETRLAAGAQRIVLDNTYVSRATRGDVVAIAHRHEAHARCVLVDTPLHEAQTNVVVRMLERHGRLLEPEELAQAAKADPNMVAPTVLFRMVRELERPAPDEGFSAIDVIPFARRTHGDRTGSVIALELLGDDAAKVLRALPEGPILVVGWSAGGARPDALCEALALETGRTIEVGFCAHDSGSPVCWCRPPLPGLWVAFARRHGLDPAKSVLVAPRGAGSTWTTMARNLGLTLRDG